MARPSVAGHGLLPLALDSRRTEYTWCRLAAERGCGEETLPWRPIDLEMWCQVTLA